MTFRITKDRLAREDGQTTAEYAFVVSLIVLGVIAVLGLYATAVGDKLGSVAARVASLA